MLSVALMSSSGCAAHAVLGRLGGGVRWGHLGHKRRAIEGEIRNRDLPGAWWLATAFDGLSGATLGGVIYLVLFIQFKPC